MRQQAIHQHAGREIPQCSGAREAVRSACSNWTGDLYSKCTTVTYSQTH